MFEKIIVSPLNLYLDYMNPRFIIPYDSKSTQQDIINYLLENEDVLTLAKRLLQIESLLPGERVVVCKENEKYIILEGNRRVSICKMFLDRSQIPNSHKKAFPIANQNLIENIKEIEVDIVQSREVAKKYLAARHINGVRDWSTVAKARFSYEEYKEGKSIDDIMERTSLSRGSINTYIKKYMLLSRGINSPEFTEEEKEKIAIHKVEPDKLLRLFIGETRSALGLYYDASYNLCSNKLSVKDLNEVIHILTRKAFLDNEVDTRTSYRIPSGKSVYDFIKHILVKYENKNNETDLGLTSNNGYNNKNAGNDSETNNSHNQNGTDESENQNSYGQERSNNEHQQSGGPEAPKGGSNVPVFFRSLCWQSIDKNLIDNRGILHICNEIYNFSAYERNITNYPIAASFLIRSLIEHTLKYYARNKGFWNRIKTGKPTDNDPQLSHILDYYKRNLPNIISDANLRNIFTSVFLSQSTSTSLLLFELNTGIHSPETFIKSPLSLQKIPSEGLLTILNYFLN